ncbi:hypothetical protein GCM10010300_34590 [Streptomyces olivaceoviridis]|nr:hypothetical protein GCM10010300_34590 [Streptomyces olivaceoviridis]
MATCAAFRALALRQRSPGTAGRQGAPGGHRGVSASVGIGRHHGTKRRISGPSTSRPGNSGSQAVSSPGSRRPPTGPRLPAPRPSPDHPGGRQYGGAAGKEVLQAAAAVEDRASTARALARAALAAGRREPPQGLGSTDRAVSRRIAACQAAPPPRLWPLAVTVLALDALTALGAADATGDPLRLLEPVLARE